MRGKPNPFLVRNPDGNARGWDWCDENGFPSGRLYSTHRAALRALLKYEGELRLRRLWAQIRGMLREPA